MSDIGLVAVAMIGLAGTAITALFAYLAQRAAAEAAAISKETGIRVDGRMDEMLRLTSSLARAEGMAAGTAAERGLSSSLGGATLLAEGPTESAEGKAAEAKPLDVKGRLDP